MANAPTSQVPPTKATWIVICLAFIVAVFLYGIVGMLAGKPTKASSGFTVMQITLGALAVIQLVASIAWLQFKTQVPVKQAFALSTTKEPMQNPMEFQTNSIIAMAIAEACSIYGLVLRFMGAPITTYAIFAAGSLLVLGGFILPRGIAYWNAYEAQQKAEKEPSPFSS